MIDQILSKLRGVNLDDFEIFGKICTAQKHSAYIMMLDDYIMWTNMYGQRCEKDVKSKTL